MIGMNICGNNALFGIGMLWIWCLIFWTFTTALMLLRPFIPDFSDVPFRLNFMLFSEKNHVKALKKSMGFAQAIAFQTPCWSHTPRTNYGI